ncbi:hypothetical protein SAMN05661096_01244 [Marivirga sericea]|uniref:DUF2127 domain-containing protein n=1 Tax=Marivirga sericea TaxID=1028 RepID=A0A1X7J2J7_9BACT|nr:hypothetical protein SAMN05661096_01244 [Marivirga sericea]
MLLRKTLQFTPKLFLIDALGAFFTAFLLGVVLSNFQHYFGMPKEILRPLAITALIFCIYSFSCYLFLKRNWRPFLIAIAVANFLYCICTSILIALFRQELTLLGLIYFIGEIAIVGILIYVELSVAKKKRIEQ